jgi:hypothetical protein
MPGKLRRVTLRLTVVTAKRTRKCKRNSKHKIGPGERALELREAGPAGSGCCYCSFCAIEMLNAAHEDLRELAQQLGAATEAERPASAGG